jgi:Swt1-like HEPN
MTTSADVYAFVFRGLLAEEALDNTQRVTHFGLTSTVDSEVSRRLPLDLLDESIVSKAKRMAAVYMAIAAFENTVREFVSKRLLEEKDENWWETSVPEGVRNRANSRREEEKKIRWHTPRGDAPINYTEFGELSSIINQNWEHFEDHIQSQEWAKQIFSTLERSRNVIMHSGDLSLEDVERIGTDIRDWVRQVGA